MELKKHVVKGMAWTFAEKALTAVFQMFVGLVLMNFLFPDDYGTIQILVVFTSVCSVFVDSGFSAALIRRKEVGQAEYSAVFFFNIFTACGLYLVLLAVTPFLASYYNAPVMRTLAPVLFLLVPVNSFSNIQNTILTRRFDFKTISKYTLWATLAGSCVASAWPPQDAASGRCSDNDCSHPQSNPCSCGYAANGAPRAASRLRPCGRCSDTVRAYC